MNVTEGAVTLKDLNSQNGVYVNGRRITEVPLSAGDRIMIGGHELEFVVNVADRERFALNSPNNMRELSKTQRLDEDDVPLPDTGMSTRRADPLELLATVADKTLALGRAADAERMIQGHLRGGIEAARQGSQLAPERSERMASLALRLAVPLRKAEWIHYVFELYSVLAVPCPAPIVETLYTAVRQVPQVNVNLLRSYIEVLRQRGASFGPAERFLVQRIEGLERIVMA